MSGPSSQLGPCPFCGQPHADDVLLCPTSEKLLPLENRILDGKFRLLRQLGEGGMGAVWKAENTLVKKNVAIKLMHVQFSRNEGVLARFRNEATAAGRIGSKHICDILDLGKSELGPYIVMELLNGSDFAHFIQQRGPVDPGTLALIMRQALVGLQAAHAVGIVHRDLKPENIFLHEPEPGRLVVKLMDFGISKFSEGSEAGKTGMGVLMGTPEYMSPEQTEGAANVDHRTDIWAMGVIMFWALTGKNPFSGPTLAATLMNVAKGDAPSLATLTPHLPLPLIEIVARCLKRDPQQRWPSAHAVHDALAPFESTEAGIFKPADTVANPTLSSTPPPTSTPSGATVASQHVPVASASPPPTPGSPTWSNQISAGPQSAPTIGEPPSWTVNEDFGRPESLSGGGHGTLIAVIVVIVLGIVGGGWLLWSNLSGSKSNDDDTIAAASAGEANDDDAAQDDDAGATPADDGKEPAAEAGDDGEPAGEGDGANQDGGVAAGDDAAADGGVAADDAAADDNAGDDGSDDNVEPSGGNASGGGTKTSNSGKKPSGGNTASKPKPLRLVAAKRVGSDLTHAQAKAHCGNLSESNHSGWKLPDANETRVIRGGDVWLQDGRFLNSAGQPQRALGPVRKRAVCVARLRI